MFYEKPNAKTTMEDPVIVLEVVKPQEVDEFSDDESVEEVIPALKRGGVDADSDDEESVESKNSDDESVASKESDDVSESGKKVTWVVDKPTTRSGRVIQQAPDWIRAIETEMASTAINAATSNYIQKAWDQCPKWCIPLFLGDLNINLESPRDERDEQIAEEGDFRELADMSRNFLQPRRRQARGRWSW